MFIYLIIIIFILLVIDIYGYHGLRKLYRIPVFSPHKRIITRAYWFMSAGFILFSIVWTIIIRNSPWPDYVQYRSYFYITGAFILIFLPKLLYLIFVILDDLTIFILWINRRLQNRKTKMHPETPQVLPVLPIFGFVLSVVMFAWVLYGVVYGRFNFKVTQVEVEIPGLPDSFDGFRIIHITDTHFGSFARKRPVEKGLQKIGKIPHDILVFTGDMVNNEAIEAAKFIECFQAIKSSYGKFSILGNHDMGDYRRWYTIDEKMTDVGQLEEVQEAMGFHLLRNQHYFINRGGDSLMIVGIDNWGLPPFAQYGDLDMALGNFAQFPFKILLSHDPSHWRAQVIPETDIMLTLSGHTHGMQAGFITRWFQWSPISVKYPEWGGLYHEGHQKLYVSRGFGFLGFPGRLGMWPEITLLVLRKK